MYRAFRVPSTESLKPMLIIICTICDWSNNFICLLHLPCAQCNLTFIICHFLAVSMQFVSVTCAAIYEQWANTFEQVNTQTIILKCEMCLHFLCSKNGHFIEIQIDEFLVIGFSSICCKLFALRMVRRLSKYTFFQFIPIDELILVERENRICLHYETVHSVHWILNDEHLALPLPQSVWFEICTEKRVWMILPVAMILLKWIMDNYHLSTKCWSNLFFTFFFSSFLLMFCCFAANGKLKPSPELNSLL